MERAVGPDMSSETQPGTSKTNYVRKMATDHMKALAASEHSGWTISGLLNSSIAKSVGSLLVRGLKQVGGSLLL
jgi:hypothetical protein